MKLSFICFLVAVSSTAWAQESSSILPDAPAVSVVQPAAKRIAAPTRVRFALEAADGLLRGLDGYTTHRLLSDPCGCHYEIDPIAPPTGNPAAQAAFQAGAGFLVVGGSRWLERRGHPKWARALLIADIVSEGIAVGNNLVQFGNKPPVTSPVGSKTPPATKPVYQ